jgi:hypothetical protein
LKEELADAVLLYEPISLKYAIKIAKKVEKSLARQNKILKSVSKNNSFQFSKIAKIKEPDSIVHPIIPTPIASDPSSKQFTLEQKCSLRF